MAIVQPTGRIQAITSTNNGDLFILGNNSNEADVGGWAVWLIPDSGGFTGTVSIMRRPEGKGAADNNVGFVTSPYRRIVVAGVAADCQIDSTPLTTVCEALVQANGASIALFVSCTAGSASVYTRPLQGPTSF